MDEFAEISEKANEIILESISDGVFTVDRNWRIMSFNRAAEEITGTLRWEAIGRYCWEVFRSNMCEGDCALKRTMKEGRSFVSSATSIINSRRQRVPITVSTSPLKDEHGRIVAAWRPSATPVKGDRRRQACAEHGGVGAARRNPLPPRTAAGGRVDGSAAHQLQRALP